MTPRIRVGNARRDGADHRGWFVGHFLGDPDDPRTAEALEVKWGVHPAGEQRHAVAAGGEATTISVLIRGRFRLRFPDRELVLEREGDYVLWTAGVPHDWRAEEDSVVLTIRWPSKPAGGVEPTAQPGRWR